MNKYIYKVKKKVVGLFLFINKHKHKYLLEKDIYTTPEELDALDYIEEHGIDTYTGELSREYNSSDIEVFYDTHNCMKYVYWNSKRMYMPRNMCIQQIQDYTSFLYSEQDIHSPHSYNQVNIPDGAVVADIGAAEGNFTLDIIDRVRKVYLYECDTKWLEALNETFKNYKDKVVIINTFINKNNPLDKHILEIPDVIKLDAEGTETEIITSSEIIRKYKPTIAAAAYHNGEDADRLKKSLSQYYNKTYFTDGFLMFLYSFKTSSPLLRRGLIIAEKN
jgi:Dimethyladenosine transferase (rRNA methylation)